MTRSINSIIKAITDLNNKYRDPKSNTKVKLELLWEIGDCLVTLGVKKPHSMGWKIQEETRGLIKRPTIFRGHKIRMIWKKKEDLLRDVGGLKKLTFITEMLPLIDPDQEVRKKLSEDEILSIYKLACKNDGVAFKEYLNTLKSKYSHGRLGKPLDKTRHLHKMEKVVECFKELQVFLIDLFKVEDKKDRESFISAIPVEEFKAMSNMRLSLTTKNNFKLYKKLGPDSSDSSNQKFKYLYDHFRELLSKVGDTDRARLRRLISAEAMAQLSDMISSIQSEDSVKDFNIRQKLSIGL